MAQSIPICLLATHKSIKNRCSRQGLKCIMYKGTSFPLSRKVALSRYFTNILGNSITLNHSNFLGVMSIGSRTDRNNPSNFLDTNKLKAFLKLLLNTFSPTVFSVNGKGQIISKGLFDIPGFFQKTNEQICFYYC